MCTGLLLRKLHFDRHSGFQDFLLVRAEEAHFYTEHQALALGPGLDILRSKLRFIVDLDDLPVKFPVVQFGQISLERHADFEL